MSYAAYLPYGYRKVTPKTFNWVQTASINGGAWVPTNKSYAFLAKDTLGVYTENFHEKMKRGDLLPHTVYKQITMEHEIAPSTYHQESPGGSTATTQGYSYVDSRGHCLNGITHLADTSGAQALLHSSAARISSKGWDGLTFASEIPSLKRMFSKTARRMSRLHERKYKRFTKDGKRVRLPKRLQSDFSFDNLWLEGRYGWRTLAYDLRDLNNAVRDWDSTRKIHTERSGFNQSNVQSSDSTETWSAGVITTRTDDVTTHSIRGSVAAMFTPSRVITDPVNTAWELIPYSFVVDWFLDVGQTLQSNKLQLLSKAITSSVSVKSETTRTVTVSVTPNAGWTQTFNETYIGKCTQLQRIPQSISMTPVILTDSLLDPNKLTDLGYLLRGGKRPRRG